MLLGALFLLVGVIYERRHTKLIAEFGGLASVMPKYALIFAVTTVGAIGLPLTIGFVGEFASLAGMFITNAWFAFLGGIGVIAGAVYMLSLYRRVFYGRLENVKNRNLPDLNYKELAALVPLSALIITLGIYPNLLLKPIEISVQKNVIEQMATRAASRQTKDKILELNGEGRTR